MSAYLQEQYIELALQQEHYAIRIQDIHEIIKLQPITEIPNCQPYVRGIINLRGVIVPVVSLRQLFGLHEVPYTKATRIVVVNHREESVGILVDEVSKVSVYQDIQKPPVRVGGVSGDYITGIGIRDGALVGILKLDELLVRS